MKRDLDICRQLLLEIERQGTESALHTLRTTSVEGGERVRFHLNLLIDAGLVKEVDRTAGGIPCVRLTHAAYELLDLARREATWNEAKAWVEERTGGQSLEVLRDVLARWARDAAATATYQTPTVAYQRRPRSSYLYERYRYAGQAAPAPQQERSTFFVRPEFRDRLDWGRVAGEPCDYEAREPVRGASLPIYLV
jgi:hypothetical protein